MLHLATEGDTRREEPAEPLQSAQGKQATSFLLLAEHPWEHAAYLPKHTLPRPWATLVQIRVCFIFNNSNCQNVLTLYVSLMEEHRGNKTIMFMNYNNINKLYYTQILHAFTRTKLDNTVTGHYITAEFIALKSKERHDLLLFSISRKLKQ